MLFEKQQYQQDCVDNIINAVQGVDFDRADFTAMASNLEALAGENSIYRQFEIFSDAKRLDVLMETGTGKTFTYLQTIFELNKCYGLSKFIIVLPRIAIKQGVIQNIKLTDEYFFNLYKKHISFIDYPKDSLSRIQSEFIERNDLCILITTNSSFNSEKNNINKKTETLFAFGSLWDGIATCKPVVIIDEPHLLKGQETQKGLAKLADSLLIRFGATFPTDKVHKLSNVVYTLDSMSAFRQYLVKRIGVSTLYTENLSELVSVRNIRVHDKRFDFCFCRDGRPVTVTLRRGDDVGARSGLHSYNGKTVTRISTSKVSLSNGEKLQARINYTLSTDEIRLMIRKAIERHFEKEERLFGQGIKALTLVFIPNIADFRDKNNPRIKRIFEEEYKEKRKEIYASAKANRKTDYLEYLDRDLDGKGELCVHEGYFSGDRGSQEDRIREGVDLILKEKERLLSFDTPLRFVFSVWALQEGWDNPNIFTICKLVASNKEVTCRQQVGRGLRLAVNQQGKRLTEGYVQSVAAFHDVNTLDMIVSGYEQTFISQIQHEISEASLTRGNKVTLDLLREEMGLNDYEAASLYTYLIDNEALDGTGRIKSQIASFLEGDSALSDKLGEERVKEISAVLSSKSPVTDNNQKRDVVKIKDGQWQEFKELWETLMRTAKIKYREIDDTILASAVSKQFNNEEITSLSAHTTHQRLNTRDNRIESIDDEYRDHEISEEDRIGARFNAEKFVYEFMKEEKLPITFACKLFSKVKREWFTNDPGEAHRKLLHFYKENIHAGILQSVDYKFVQTNIYPNLLQKQDGASKKEIPYTALGKLISEVDAPPDHFLYDRVAYDSAIEKRNITEVASIVSGSEIKVFAKLPRIHIPTPYKKYSPDFAYLVKQPDGRTLYLVVEAKGYDTEDEIPEEEKTKINYGRKFFEQLNKELPDVDVVYETRTNKQQLGLLIKSVIGGK